MSQLDFMVRRVPYYFDGMDGLTNYIGDAIFVINHGTYYNGKIVLPFIEDDKLDRREISYLKWLKDSLLPIYKQLLSAETQLFSEDITKHKFKEMISEHIFAIDKEDELLEESMKHHD